MEDSPRNLPVHPDHVTEKLVSVVDFWRDAGPLQWFRKDLAFDTVFRNRFLELHETAARGECDDAAVTPMGSLALVLLLDQFPRNAFRDTARAFATDGQALQIADQAIERGADRAVEAPLQPFFYMPFMHSENLADQQRCVALTAGLDENTRHFAAVHRDTIARFGRFPHRNGLLGRSTTEEEQAFLNAGGFAG